MSDIILGVAIGAVIGVVGMYMLLKIAVNILHRRLEQDLEQALKKAQTESAIPCRVELHNNVFFVYNNETNEFMAQGSTLDELRERIRARWADRKVSVVAGDEEVLEKLRAQI